MYELGVIDPYGFFECVFMADTIDEGIAYLEQQNTRWAEDCGYDYMPSEWVVSDGMLVGKSLGKYLEYDEGLHDIFVAIRRSDGNAILNR